MDQQTDAPALGAAGTPTADLYPEVGAGGFTRCDGNVEFYGRVTSLLRKDMTVLDFGAGRGRLTTDDPVLYRRSLRLLKGKARLVVAADIDPVVASNPSVDCAVVIEERKGLPFASASFDMIVADFTLEHIRHPEATITELDRVLKPQGWFCARTPNRWGYIAVGASLVPSRWHRGVLRTVQPERRIEDIFPAAYLLNTPSQLRRYFPADHYDDYSYFYDSEPAYFGPSVAVNRAARAVMRLLPSRLSSLLMVFKRKKALE